MSYSGRDLAVVDLMLARLDSAKDRATLIAVDGHSAAGKTTLSNHIQSNYAKVAIIRTDDFYRVMSPDDRAALDAEGGYQKHYDWERLRDEVLLPLSKGQNVSYRRYNWESNQVGDAVTVINTGIVVVESCYAARPDLRRFYDHAIVVKAPLKR